MSDSGQSCQICQSIRSRLSTQLVRDYVTGESFEVRQCEQCGMAFTWPQPTNMNRFYPSRYRRYDGTISGMLGFLYKRRARAWVQAFGETGTVLEIGCGAGWMLRALRQYGWTIFGIERTIQSADSASILGLPVFVGELAALKSEPRFDLIILFHVLEHLPDPLTTIRQCAKLLKGGGALVIAVPNLESWQARWTGRSWFHLDVPRHLFHFSARSLSIILREAGLTIGKARFVSFEHDPYGWTQSFLNLVGFPQNLLTKMLMGMDRRAFLTPPGFGMVILGAFLIVPSLVLAGCSWLCKAGASIEILACKPMRESHPEVQRITEQ